MHKRRSVDGYIDCIFAVQYCIGCLWLVEACDVQTIKHICANGVSVDLNPQAVTWCKKMMPAADA